MKSKRKLRFLIPIFCIVLSLVIYRLANGLMREREFQHMPEIYEIPDTSQVFTKNNVTTVRTNYIIKSEYTDLDLLHQKVQDFIYDNNIINTSINCSETEEYYINLRFYRISEQRLGTGDATHWHALFGNWQPHISPDRRNGRRTNIHHDTVEISQFCSVLLI